MSDAGTPPEGDGAATGGGDPWRQAERWFSPDAPVPERRCAVCGAHLDADQTYCLECGSPTPLAPRLQRPSRVGAFAAGALVALALGAGAVALAAMDDDGAAVGTAGTTAVVTVPPSTSTVPVFRPPAVTAGTLPADTSGTAPPPITTGFATVTAPPTIPTAPVLPTTAAPPVTAPPTTTAGPPAPVVSSWPDGRTAYTVVLSSVRDVAEARATEERVRAAGEEAGLLVSSDHPNLRPGYFVVYSGVYDSRETALARAEDLRATYPGAYAREVRS